MMGFMPRPSLEDTPTTGVFEEGGERRHADGRRNIKLTRDERSIMLRQRLAESAAYLFLDLEKGHTWAEIAEELEITLPQLKSLTKTAEFDAAYNQLYAEIGHDPRYRATIAQITDMLGLATKTIRDILIDESVAGGVRLRAVDMVYEVAGIRAPEGAQSERKALANFLKEHGLHPDQRVEVPQEYDDAMEHYNVEIIEGEVEEIEE